MASKASSALSLRAVPDHTTLYRAFHRLRRKPLDRLNRTFLQELEGQEEVLVHDTTGFSPTQASLHYLARSGRRYQHFIKGAYTMGLASHYILAATSRVGPGADSVELAGLRRRSSRYGKHAGGRISYLALADAGFDSKQVQPGDVILPRRPHKHWPQGERLLRLEFFSQTRLEGLYGKRWVCETVNSVIKCKLGDGERSRKSLHRLREPILNCCIVALLLCLDCSIAKMNVQKQ